MEEITNESVNNEEIAEPQQQEQVETQEEEQQPVKQEPDLNSQFAKVRRDSERKAKDSIIAELYGDTHGIKTYEEYQSAIKKAELEKQAEDKGLDPEFYTEFSSLKEKLTAMEKEKAYILQDQELKGDPIRGDLYKAWEREVRQSAQEYGVDLKTAFLLQLDEKLHDVLSGTKSKTEQEVVQKMLTNEQSTPGSLGEASENKLPKISEMNDSDFDKLVNAVKRGEKINL